MIQAIVSGWLQSAQSEPPGGIPRCRRSRYGHDPQDHELLTYDIWARPEINGGGSRERHWR
jgi:hypothetical protein